MQPQAGSGTRGWPEIIRDSLKENNVRLVTYVPDNVLTPLINALHDDPFFTTFCCTREEEAVGIVSGAWLGGMLGIVLMQTSGYATLPNVLASLSLPYQLPTLMIISERGTLGEFNIGQTMVCRTMRPSLDSMNIENHTLRRLEDVEFITSRAIQQAVSTQAPAALILNPLLTGGKVEKKEKA